MLNKVCPFGVSSHGVSMHSGWFYESAYDQNKVLPVGAYVMYTIIYDMGSGEWMHGTEQGNG